LQFIASYSRQIENQYFLNANQMLYLTTVLYDDQFKAPWFHSW